jgi:excinuclease ABC subunit B
VRGDVIEVYPTYDDFAYRIELWGDEVESLSQIDPLLGQVKQTYQRLPIYPKTHYVMSERPRKAPWTASARSSNGGARSSKSRAS